MSQGDAPTGLAVWILMFVVVATLWSLLFGEWGHWIAIILAIAVLLNVAKAIK